MATPRIVMRIFHWGSVSSGTDAAPLEAERRRMRARDARSKLRRYGYAVAATVAALAARFALDRIFHYYHPYAAFYVAILLTAWYGGLGPAVLAIGLGGAASIFSVLSAGFAHPPGTQGLLGFEFYFIVSITGVILLEAQRRSERAAVRAREELQQAQRFESIGMLAGGIAHDFNNLLTGVLGNASLALAIAEPNAKLEQLLREVIQAAERGADLTGKLLAYAGKTGWLKRDLDFSDVVRSNAERYRHSLSSRITLKLDLRDGLPPLSADPAMMQQLISSLLSNAAEAIGENRSGTITVRTELMTIEGMRALRAQVGEVQPGRYIVLTVADTGMGIDESLMGRIFEPFFTTKFLGRGLGLAAVAGIVRAQNGAVMVSSTPEQGSVFTVLLPV